MARRERRRATPGRLVGSWHTAADVVAHLASTVWRSLFGTAAALCVVAGVLDAVGRTGDSYSFILIAALLAALATSAALLALRVETDPDPYDPEVTP